MEQRIRTEILHFVQKSPLGRFPDSGQAYFDEPLVGFAAAEDALFREYQTVIGAFHQTPQEVLSGAKSVVVWILPLSQATRQSNRRQTRQPSRAWSQTRSFGDKLNVALRRHLVAWLEEQGQRAVAPQLAPNWQEFADTPVGAASSWSERHAAYAAGLGTFSLNDALITPKGIAHRCGSVVTDLALTPSKRPYAHHHANCLYFHDGSCGACIERCPAGALSRAGHDKVRCRTYVYTTLIEELAEAYATPQPGCGLCQTRVPCEERIPVGRQPD
jgi:epoxyqueuosine reductase QueG